MIEPPACYARLADKDMWGGLITVVDGARRYHDGNITVTGENATVSGPNGPNSKDNRDFSIDTP